MTFELNIVEMLLDDPKFSIFVKALIMTQLIHKLKESGPFTVMAPTNLAFTKLPEAKLLEMLKPLNKANLSEIIKYHIIEGKMLSEELAGYPLVGTLQNQSLRIEATGFECKVNGANLQSRNIEVSNGVVHCINAVLFPAIAMEAV